MSINDNKSYQFYKKYHKNKINKIIHILCIPLIVWSLSVLLNSIVFNVNMYFIKDTTNINSNLTFFNLDIYLSSIILFFYLLMYTIIDTTCFKPMLFFLSFIWITSYYFLHNCSYPYYYAIIVNIFSWIMQFIGHGVFEGNRPALIDSISQSFLMAPLFSYYEFKELID